MCALYNNCISHHTECRHAACTAVCAAVALALDGRLLNATHRQLQVTDLVWYCCIAGGGVGVVIFNNDSNECATLASPTLVADGCPQTTWPVAMMLSRKQGEALQVAVAKAAALGITFNATIRVPQQQQEIGLDFMSGTSQVRSSCYSACAGSCKTSTLHFVWSPERLLPTSTMTTTLRSPHPPST